MKNSFNWKKFMFVVFIIVIIVIICLGLYYYFIGNNNSSNNSSNNNSSNNTNGTKKEDTKISSIYQVILGEEEQVFTMNGKNVSLKLLNKELYVNNNKVSNVKTEYAYVTEQIIIFTYKGQCNDIITYVIDSDGKEVPFTKNNYQLYDFRMLDGKCVAAGSEQCPCNEDDGTCKEIIAISLTYDGSKLIIQ